MFRCSKELSNRDGSFEYSQYILGWKFKKGDFQINTHSNLQHVYQLNIKLPSHQFYIMMDKSLNTKQVL